MNLRHCGGGKFVNLDIAETTLLLRSAARKNIHLVNNRIGLRQLIGNSSIPHSFYCINSPPRTSLIRKPDLLGDTFINLN